MSGSVGEAWGREVAVVSAARCSVGMLHCPRRQLQLQLAPGFRPCPCRAERCAGLLWLSLQPGSEGTNHWWI